MKEALSKNTNNTKEDLSGIRKDMESIGQRLSALKDHSIEALSEQIDNLYSSIESVKYKGFDMGGKSVDTIINHTRKQPIKMLLGAFSLGVISYWLIKRK